MCSFTDYNEESDCLPGPSKKARLQYEDVYSDDELPTKNIDVLTPFNSTDIKAGSYVILKLDECSKAKKINQNCYKYAAVCQGPVDDDGEVEVVFLRLTNSTYTSGQLFRLDERDVSHVSFDQIKCVLNKPILVTKGKRKYYKFLHELDIYEKM